MPSPAISVDNEDALVDEVLQITVNGLGSNQAITVRCEVTEKNMVFAGTGCFTTDTSGCVDLTRHPSTSGTYTGVSAMGLFWSMKSIPGQPFGTRLIKNNASYPVTSVLEVYLGHLTLEELYETSTAPDSQCRKLIRRWYMAKGVQKVSLSSGRLRGKLFLPQGSGPFPGVIDMFGTVGSIVESRAALFASRGIASIALPYFMYDGLPKNMEDVELEYFMEAVDWLASQPGVDSEHIGIIGVSKGGEIALQMAYHCKKIKAVVSINGAPFFSAAPMWYKGNFIGKSMLAPERTEGTEEGMRMKYTMYCDLDKYLPLWEADVHTLIIHGLDDQCLDPEIFINLESLYPAHRRHLLSRCGYLGAGHLIEPPYAPLARSTTKHVRGVLGDFGIQRILWGGNTVDHAHAQEDSWRKILHHFRSHLCGRSMADDHGALTTGSKL